MLSLDRMVGSDNVWVNLSHAFNFFNRTQTRLTLRGYIQFGRLFGPGGVSPCRRRGRKIVGFLFLLAVSWEGGWGWGAGGHKGVVLGVSLGSGGGKGRGGRGLPSPSPPLSRRAILPLMVRIV